MCACVSSVYLRYVTYYNKYITKMLDKDKTYYLFIYNYIVICLKTHKVSSSSLSSRAFSVSRLSSSTNCFCPLRLSSSSSLRNTRDSVSAHNKETHEHVLYIHMVNRVSHLNFMRLVQMRGGQKKDTTSLEIAVSVVIAPHQIFVRRACNHTVI